MLHSHFFGTAADRPRAPALWVDGRRYDYGELSARARRVAAGLHRAASESEAAAGAGLETVRPAAEARFCLLFTHRGIGAYAGLLGILAAGMAYVPLNPRLPPARIAAIIMGSGARLMLVDRQCAGLLPEILQLLDQQPRVFLLEEEGDVESESLVAAGHHSQDIAPLMVPAQPCALPAGSPADSAYMLFTSGTTGTPKGLPISHANADAYVTSARLCDTVLPQARYAQFCELTFDPSVHDMFVCWSNGGCLYVPRTVDVLYIVDFIKEHAITHWNSVPSVAGLMQQFRKLLPGSFPSLRVTLFGGEALPKALALGWLRAAPNSSLTNLYGPTETTVACTRFDITPAFLEDPHLSIMPLGWPLPGTEVLIVDAQLEPVKAGEQGELLIGGPQVARGYLAAAEADQRKFFTRDYPGCAARQWYRSGDAASESPRFGVLFHGRLDTQVKIRGNRIELEEVEHVLRRAADAAMCAVIAWPLDAAGRAEGLIAFVLKPRIDAGRTLELCRRQLPPHAVPTAIVVLDAFPLNVNGKTDRNRLAALYGHGAPAVARA